MTSAATEGVREPAPDTAKVTVGPILLVGEWKQVLAALVPYADMREIREKIRADLARNGYLREHQNHTPVNYDGDGVPCCPQYNPCDAHRV